MRSMRRALGALWKRREPVLWIALVAFVLNAQWPTLKGWYYGAPGAEAPVTAIEWRTDFQQALAEARSGNRLILADFSAGWCPPCIAMKHETWPHADVIQAVSTGFVPLVVDVDQHPELSARYEVPGIPSLLILDADGRLVRRHNGFLPRDGMLRFLANSL